MAWFLHFNVNSTKHCWHSLFSLWIEVTTKYLGKFYSSHNCSTLSTDTPTQDICEGAMKNVSMCPICDQFCNVWPLQEACRMTQAKYLFDNGSTVFFAIFMTVWAVIFTEMWKRYSAEITHRWDVFGYVSYQFVVAMLMNCS